jgi:hypothetical protein
MEWLRSRIENPTLAAWKTEAMNVDNFFGECPVCGRRDGYINIGRGHWFYCRAHKLRWLAGSNLFSDWRHQTEEEQKRIYNELEFGAFAVIEPAHSAGGPIVIDQEYYDYRGQGAPTLEEIEAKFSTQGDNR